jgi:hypothetical protein
LQVLNIGRVNQNDDLVAFDTDLGNALLDEMAMLGGGLRRAQWFLVNALGRGCH